MFAKNLLSIITIYPRTLKINIVVIQKLFITFSTEYTQLYHCFIASENFIQIGTILNVDRSRLIPRKSN